MSYCFFLMQCARVVCQYCIFSSQSLQEYIVVIYFISFWMSCIYYSALIKTVCAGIYGKELQIKL